MFKKIQTLFSDKISVNGNDETEKLIPSSELVLLFIVLTSIITSLYLYFIELNETGALFIGLWAPTVMSLVNFINLKFKD